MIGQRRRLPSLLPLVEELRELFADEKLLAMGIADAYRSTDPDPLPKPSVTCEWLLTQCLQRPVAPGRRMRVVPEQIHLSEIIGNERQPALKRYYRLPPLHLGSMRTALVELALARKERTESFRDKGKAVVHLADDGLVTRQLTRRERLFALWQAVKFLEKDGEIRAVRWRNDFLVEFIHREVERATLGGHDTVDD